MELKYWPFGETSATEFRRFSLGILTLSNLNIKCPVTSEVNIVEMKVAYINLVKENKSSNYYHIRPLSTPFNPIL